MLIPHYTRRDVLGMLVIAAGYALLGKLVLNYFSAAGNVTLVWFPGGMALAILLAKGLKLWPGVFAGAFAAGLLVENAYAQCFVIALGNTLESLSAAWLLNRHSSFSPRLKRPRDLAWLTGVGVVCALVSAAMGPAALWLDGAFPAQALPGVIFHWWMSDVFGIISTTPFILIWRRWPSDWFDRTRLAETLGFITVCVLTALVVFLDVFQAQLGELPHGYWMYAVMFWGGIRFGRHGVQLVAVLTAVTALMGAAQGLGYFARDFELHGMWNYWLFQTLLCWIGTVLTLTLNNEREIRAKLSDSEQRLQAIIDASPVAYVLNDDRGNITLLNPAFVATFGYAPVEVPSLSDWSLKAYPDPKYRAWVEATWRQRSEQARQSGRPFQAFEVDVRCRDDQVKHVLIGAGLLEGVHAGEQLITLLDMTAQTRASRALSNSNILLQSILETLPLRVFWKDTKSRYMGGNSLFARDAGLESVAELLGKNDHDLAWWEQAAAYQQDDRQVMQSGQGKLNVEEPLTMASGETAWLSTYKLPLRNSEDQIIGVVGAYEDISMRKRIEDQLLWRTTFLEALLEASPDGILAVDKDGCKLLQNQRVADLWSIPAEIAGDPDDAAQVAFVKNKLSNPAEFLEKVTYLYAHPDVSCRDEIELTDGVILERYSAPVKDRLGRYHGRIWQFTDVTQIRRAQRELQLKDYYQRALMDNFPFILWIKDAESRYQVVSKVFTESYAVSMDAVIGKTDFEIFPAKLARRFRAEDLEIMRSRQHRYTEEIGKILKPATWFEVYKAPLLDKDGNVLGTVGYARDINHRKAAEENLKLAALVFENCSEAMMVIDVDNKVLNVNSAFTEITGFGCDEVLGREPVILAAGEQDASLAQAMRQSIEATGNWQGVIKNRRKNGEYYIAEMVINTIFDHEGKPHRRVALFSDITQRKRSEEQIWWQANFDQLTGIPNRHFARAQLGEEIKKVHRARRKLALLMIDLDRFKEVNDTLGHEAGDLLLQQAAKRLVASVRESDTVGRLGGDEFVVILSGLDNAESPEQVAKKLLEQLSQPFTLRTEQVYVSASVGITLYPDDGLEVSQLLKNADQAMFAAKAKGRNGYSFFTHSMQAELNARAAMLNDLRGALARQELTLFYQPIVELSTQRIYKAEALLRWRHPLRGLISPSEFVPLAEQTGLINEIGDWVFHVAVAQASRWRQILHPDFQVSINKSPMQFLDARHDPAEWIAYLRAHDAPGQSVVVEITEGLLLEANNKTAEHLLVFRDAGIQVAIDDFGTGYSSLSYLQKFDIDYLKIDQSFVRNLSAESNDFVLCEAMIVMAHKLGLKVIAEGVETQAQCDLLTSIGCDFGQGYLFSRPMAAADFEQSFKINSV
ncbi:EAL domain-containing protein [Methylomonas sp. SURF-2]|uniref:EAL domain-containing protein n=1 Tax=Methylomonas subterranea TaxID=2952225 RepID=A0ABT1TG36_9GAMM|nr:EAL domain-containing protein [Methylomonas sp. SURF-2]MCQ8104223.1 EAL domain-containing protein [Methylomonas sp. SURF-2]